MFNNLVRVGQIARSHGYKGELRLQIHPGFQLKKSIKGPVFIQFAGKPVPFFFESYLLQDQELLIKLEDIDSEEAARALCGRSFWLDILDVKKMPGAEESGEWQGFQVWEGKKLLGEIQEVIQQAPLVVKVIIQQKEVLLPINSGTLVKVEEKKKSVWVKLPEGLLDFYLQQDT